MQNLAVRNQSQALLTPQIPVGDEARVAGILGAIEQHLGFIPDALRLYSFSPPLLENVVSNIGYFNSGERLSPALMAMIRYLVSADANCTFCIDLNEGFLSNMGVDLDKVRAARGNPDVAPVSDKEKPLLKIALKSVTDPESVGPSDINAARNQGWSDRDIFDAVAQAASNRSLNYLLRTFKVDHQGVYA